MCSPCPAHHPTPAYRQNLPLRVPFTTLVATMPLRRVSARSPCHRAKPSPPSLSPCTGPRCLHAIHGYRRSPPSCLLSVLLVSCPPLVSHHRHARLCFPPHRQCRAILPLISPLAQDQELHQISQLLPDRKDRDLHRCWAPVPSAALVSSASPLSPSMSRSSALDRVKQVHRGPWMSPMDTFRWIVQSPAVAGSATPRASAV
jgi:hypothetical protein